MLPIDSFTDELTKIAREHRFPRFRRFARQAAKESTELGPDVVLTAHDAYKDRKGKEKTAYGPAEANKVLQLAKKIQLPKAGGRVFGGMGDRLGLGGIPTAAGISKQVTKASADAPQLFKTYDPGALQADPSIVGNLQSQIRANNVPISALSKQRAGQGTIIRSQASPDRLVQRGMDLTNAPRVPTDQRKMFNSVLLGHELDETKVPYKMGLNQFGHRSPAVLLREHNRIATLPAENAPIKSTMQALRAPREAEALKPFVDYGNSPRLSRHAIRRISDRMDQAALAGGLDKLAQVSPYQQATDWTCSAACLKAVLAHWGHDIPEPLAVEAIGTKKGRGAETTDIVNAAKKLGFDALEMSFDDISQAAALTAKDVPIICDIQSFIHEGKGHYVVLTKIDDNEAHLMDPNTPGNKRVLDAQEFVDRWWDHWMHPPHEKQDRWGIVVAPPGMLP